MKVYMERHPERLSPSLATEFLLGGFGENSLHPTLR